MFKLSRSYILNIALRVKFPRTHNFNCFTTPRFHWITRTSRLVAIAGLILISIGTGGIKPCVFSFGGDQFQLPEQQVQLRRFFNRFFTAIYVGMLISTFVTPELRKSVPCFGRDTCYPLAFGMLSLLMITALGNHHII